MNSRIFVVLLVAALTFGLWGCQDLPPNTTGNSNALSFKADISGTVTDVSTGIPVFNATVFRNSGGSVDSTHTDANGAFSFEFNQANDSVQTTITVKKQGYLVYASTFVMVGNSQMTLPIRLTVDLNTYSVLNGTVRDSATLYPLRGSTVIYAVPGFSDQVVTSIDGMFILPVNLVDRDSLPVSVTVSKTGFKTKQLTYEAHKGQTANLGNLLMQVDQGSSVGQVLGRVLDASSSQPVINATLLLTSALVTDSALSASDGSYLFSIDLKGLASLPAGLKVTKNGYLSQSFNVNFNAGSPTYQNITLVRDTTTGVTRDSGTGEAHSIALVNVTNNQVAVYGVGGIESSIITWEVRDSLGFPIDIDHQDSVYFKLMGTPVSGGAYVSPSAALTNASGRVATIINSGTVSGALQIFAWLYRKSDHVLVESTPVLLTVNAGLPDQVHFDVAPFIHNFPAYDYLDKTDAITVQVGDKYTNPVKTNTAVYFNTTGGIIDASGFTDLSGHATVNLYSGNPLPFDAATGLLFNSPNGNGWAKIVAATLGQNGIAVTETTIVLFTTHPAFPTASVNSFDVPVGGSSGIINYHITDRFGHPLAAGTHITVALQYTPPPNTTYNFTVNGNTDILLDDVMEAGPGATDFWFEVVDQTIGATESRIPASVTITIDSPNNGGGGKPTLSIPGTVGG